jgi:2-polyprenyl-3-methyl-5-hydroxy-6-metoxy-1,4-benzoquinol methylase
MDLVAWFDEKFYPGVKNSWDNTMFREYILQRVKPEHVMLDLGAGAGSLPQMNFRGKVKKVCGVDPEETVTKNPYLDEGKVGFGESIPWPDSSFDLVVSGNVLEHLENPSDVFKEVSRVLKPGGQFLFKTPNRRHYMPMIARITPLWFHKFYNGLRGRAHEDTFPTVYRANRPADILGAMAATGLRADELKLIESRPEYLRLSALTYVFGIAYERLVNSSSLFEQFRVIIIGRFIKGS